MRLSNFTKKNFIYNDYKNKFNQTKITLLDNFTKKKKKNLQFFAAVKQP